jgi:HNH endonuclease/Mrr restriction endonuclease-like protein
MAFPHRDLIKEALVEHLLSRGGSLSASETYDPLAEKFQLTDKDLEERRPNGALKWPNEIQWARDELIREGILLPLEKSGWGIWTLSSTELNGPKPPVAQEQSRELSLIQKDIEDEKLFDPTSISDARDIILRAIVQRRGQQEFRKVLLRAYKSQCAISGETFTDALEAAHIVPYSGSETNVVQNGLLLRADIHTLFDLHFLAVNPHTFCIETSPRLGGSYSSFKGRKISLPESNADWPAQSALKVHFDKLLS